MRRRNAAARIASSSRSSSVVATHRRTARGGDPRTRAGSAGTPRLCPERAGDARAIGQARHPQYRAVLLGREIRARIADLAQCGIAANERQRPPPGEVTGADAPVRLGRAVAVKERPPQHRRQIALRRMRRDRLGAVREAVAGAACPQAEVRVLRGASMKATRGAVLADTPAFRARARFGTGSLTTVAPDARATDAEASRDALSTTITSKRSRGNVWPARLASSAGKLLSPSRTGTTTLTSTPCIGGQA